MDFKPLMDRKRERFEEVEASVAAPNLYDNPKRAQEILREHSRLKEAMRLWDEFQKVDKELTESRELAKGGDELAEMARADLPDLETHVNHRQDHGSPVLQE